MKHSGAKNGKYILKWLKIVAGKDLD